MRYEDNIWMAYTAELRKRYPQKTRPWAWSEFTRAKEKRVARLARFYRKALMLSNRQDYLANNFKCEVFYRDGSAHPKLSGKGWETR